MARSESKRQKRLAKQKAKRNQKQQELKRTRHMGLAERLAQFEPAPVVDCLVTTSVEDQGMADLLIGRKAPSGELVFANFLVDLYCMGIKDCFAKILTPAEYRQNLERFCEQDVRPIDPPSARRLVEEALAYAHSLGLSPHADFRKVRPVLNGIDPAEARETFEMGKDGKPYFIAGPHQSPSECRRIMGILHNKCGPDGYHYTMPLEMLDDGEPGGRIVARNGQEFDEEAEDAEDF